MSIGTVEVRYEESRFCSNTLDLIGEALDMMGIDHIANEDPGRYTPTVFVDGVEFSDNADDLIKRQDELLSLIETGG